MDDSSEIERAEAHLKQAEADLETAQGAERHAEHELKEAVHELREAEHHFHDSSHVEVEIATTSGSYPEDHFARVPVHQLVQVELDKAANALHLTDTTSWITLVGTQQINPGLSFEANHLEHKVIIDWGPAEGGGG